MDLKVSVSQDYDASEEDSLGKPSLQVSADAKPTAFLGLRLQGRQALRNWASISTVLVILAFVMISLCLRAPKDLVRGGLTSRRLAHGGEEEDSDDAMLDIILEECLDMEEAAGWPSHHGTPTALVPMAATTQDYATVPQPAASAGFSTGPGARPFASAPQTMPGVFTSTSGSMVPDQLQPLDSPLSEGTARPSIFTPASTAPLPSIPPEEVSDFLLLSKLSADSWLDSIPDITLKGPGLQGEATASGFQKMFENYEQPSTSAEATGETSTEAEVSPGTGGVGGAALATEAGRVGPRELGNLSMHPFIRLPIIRPEAILRDFDPQRLKPMFGRSGLYMMLSRIRERLLKPALDAGEVEQLMLETEKLVRMTLARLPQQSSPKALWHWVHHLGTFFLILDAVVSVRQLLGPRMAASEWWDHLVNCLPMDYPPPEVPADANKLNKFRYNLVSRLLAAIKIYKTGKRPDLQEVLELKRMLLCTRHSISYFKDRRFDPWRSDDAKFCQAQGEVSEDSTEEEDD
ncbi:hypothetical protein Efla_002429 [Eimeria flavescens]